MHFRYAMVAALLAAGLMVAPAQAGVTDTTGGHKPIVDTTVVNHTNVVNDYRTVDNVINKTVNGGTVDNSKTVVKVKGTLNYHETSAHYSNGRYWDENNTQHYSQTLTNPSNAQITAAKAAIQSSLRDYQYNKQNGRTGYGNHYNQGSWSSSTSNNISKKTSSSTASSVSYSDYGLKGSSTALTGSVTTHLGTDYSEGAIVIGDPDALMDAYVAAGTVTIRNQQDDYYTRTDTYERTKTTTNVTTNKTVISGTKTVTYEVNASRSYSPIVLDLNGDGRIDASNGKYQPHLDKFEDGRVALFDFYGNGFPVLTEWVGQYDGLLCRPAANGTVNGTNLFGTANGFNDGYAEMASLDTNKDGQLSGSELNGLKVWIDLDSNAVAAPEELRDLSELGISSISVNHNNFRGSFVRHGQTYSSFDWWPNVKEIRKVDMASIAH